MDLSTRLSSKKTVDFNDTRYQLSDKLRSAGNKAIRSTFTLYDDKDDKKVAIRDISAAYILSDKKLPIGELLNKMLDLIVDLSDGRLDSNADAIYAWKYSKALIEIFEDKVKRKEPMTVFDNSLKNIVINTPLFAERYPGRYTVRTNFTNPKVINQLVIDIVMVFKNETIDLLHKAAIAQSNVIAEEHNNKVLNKIVNWAVNEYQCTVDSFYSIGEDPETQLKYSTNTIILHLKNGYDLSIIGTVGTERDNKFSVAIFDANDISITRSGDKYTNDQLVQLLMDAARKDPVSPLTKLYDIEADKNKILNSQLEMLRDIRPMIKSEFLDLPVAESVVGADYIWACKDFRITHQDLPDDFKVSDIDLPDVNDVYEEETEDPFSALERKTMEASGADLTNELIFNDVEQERTRPAIYDAQVIDEKKKVEFKQSATLLPGVRIKQDKEEDAPAVTGNAKPEPMKDKTKPVWVNKTDISNAKKDEAPVSATEENKSEAKETSVPVIDTSIFEEAPATVENSDEADSIFASDALSEPKQDEPAVDNNNDAESNNDSGEGEPIDINNLFE